MVVRSVFTAAKNIYTALPDALFGVVAPHYCFGCGQAGRSLCLECADLIVCPPPPRCYGCHAVSSDYTICSTCRRTLQFDSAIPLGEYEGIHKQLVLAMKMSASRAVAKDIATALALSIQKNSTTLKDKIDVIVPVPTIHAHIRERGFDHTVLMAKELSRQSGTPYATVLQRTTNTRQVGKNRKERFKNMHNAIAYRSSYALSSQRVLLIDDIITTGATLSSSATTLKRAGVKRVDCLVFASRSSV